jgi:hypothetical protein
MTTRAPNSLFALESRRGRVAVIIEADDRSQALRRLRWLVSAAPFISLPLETGTLMRLPPGVPVPSRVPYVSSRTFEEADID